MKKSVSARFRPRSDSCELDSYSAWFSLRVNRRQTNHQRSNEQQCNKASVQADKASKQGGMPKNLRTLSDISMAAIESEGLDCTGDQIADKCLNEPPILVPTETQAVSIQRHLARQEQARDFARQALRK